MDIFATIFVLFAVIVIAAVLFGGWVIISILRLIGWGVGTVFGVFCGGGCRGHMHRSKPAEQIGPTAATGGQVRYCAHAQCRAPNPVEARFCRRCGRSLPAAERVTARRVAMW